MNNASVGRMKPTVKIECNTLDATEKKVSSTEGEFKFQDQIKAKSFPSSKFDKLESAYMDELITVLIPGLEAAVEKCFGSLK